MVIPASSNTGQEIGINSSIRTGEVLTLTDQNLDAVLANPSKLPVLIDFWAPWCGPCRRQGPIVEEVAKELKDKAVVAKINIDQNQSAARKFGIRSIPTIIIFKDGKIQQTLIGLRSKSDLLNAVNQLTPAAPI